MKIYADENMPLVRQFFSELGDVSLFDGRQVTAEAVKDADILLVRSVTKVDQQLLAANTALKFVGTATIGMDHIDQPYLQQRQVPFCNAPGCNARSVVEYVLSSLFFLADKYQWQLQQKTVGIIGAGSIGSRLAQLLQVLNIPVLQCDPLRAQQEPDFPHVAFSEVCRQADILTFHVPLVKQGEFQTRHLLDSAALATLKPDCAIINAARGAVIDNQALLAEAQAGHDRPLVLDVWENEPDILLPLLPYTDIATAHIAGHSIEGKARGTEMLYQAVCRLLHYPVRLQLQQLLAVPAVEKLQINPDFGLPDVQSVARMLYDVRRDDALFRHYLGSKGFDWLRKTYPPRREFSSLHISGPVVADWIAQLGFRAGKGE
ncbi:4-phosphoerythronate dehydrogenase [Chromatiaceae bacterium AAb-1]|nr:4-phosphoerythronate dehydrogenase [Chromatiaceae bacterium AAb-1]